MQEFIKNLDYASVLTLKDQIGVLPGQVVSKTLVQNGSLGLTLFAMPAGEGISAHKSTGDAFVLNLEGECEIEIDADHFRLAPGQCIVMPAGHPHAVKAVSDFKMLLIVVFPDK